MPAKVKIEMMDDEEQQHVHTLPPVSELPIIARPVNVSAWAKAETIGAPKKGAKDKAKEFPPTWGTEDTPMAKAVNAPLGVKKALDSASQALRDRGHHVLAHLTDLAGQAAPDSAAGLANAALMAYGAKDVFKGGEAGAPVEEPAPVVPGAIETPTPPPAPKPVLPEPAPVTAGGPIKDPAILAAEAARVTDQAPRPLPSGTQDRLAALGHTKAQIDAMTLADADAALRAKQVTARQIPGSRPLSEYAPEDLANEAQRVAQMSGASRMAKGPRVAAVAGAGAALGAAGVSEAGETDPDYEAKEKALMAAMKATGHPIMKVSGDRTAEQQAKLYEKGRGKPGAIVTEKSGKPGDESRHQLGMAGDFAFVGKDGKPDFDPKLPWDTLGRMAKTQGLEWGGDWETLKDFGHVQAPAPAASVASIAPAATTPAGMAKTPSSGGTVTPAPGTPTPGIKIESMTPDDHQTAPSKSLWRQTLDPLMESAPFVAGATGGMIGATAGAPTGPGAALLGVGGAYVGGVIGEGARQLYRRLTGQDLQQPATQTMDTMSASGRSQMYQEMLGLGIRSMLTARAATKGFGSAAATQASERHGLKLSAADLSDSPIGRGLTQVMTYASATAKAATDAARRVGASNAIKSVTDALNNLTAFHSNLDTGAEIQAGVRAGAKGLSEGPIGQLYDKVKATGPAIDLRPHIQELLQTFNREGTPASARRAILSLFPKPTNTMTAPVSWGSSDPYMVTFEQAAKLRTRLGTQGRKALQAIGTDATSIATKLYGDVTDTLTRAHPDFGSASNLWRDARQSLTQRFVASVLKTSPDKIVKALGPTPSMETVDALRKTMLNLAQSAGPNTPEGVAGSKGFEALRRSWFDTHILRNAAGEADPLGMLDRMRKANGAVSGFFGINKGDVHGQQLVDTATEIGKALSRRVAIKSPSPYTRGAELLGLLEVAAKAGTEAAAKTMAGVELLPGFITWAMHRPAVAKAFVTGLTNSHTIQGAALLGRTLAGYFSSGGPEQDPEPDPSTDPESWPPVGGTPTPVATGAPAGGGTPTGQPGAKPQARYAPTDPMGGAAINVHTFDPDATATPPAVAQAETPTPAPGPAALQPKQVPSAWAKASKISAAPFDEQMAAQREQEEWAQQPLAVVKAVGDKIRHWGEDVGAYSKSTQDWLLASLGGAFTGATEGMATALEQNTTPEAVAMSMVPLHDVDKLAELTRSLGRSAEGAPGFFSRLTQAIEKVPELSARKGVAGMVDPKKVLEALKQASPDEVAWKEVVPFIREHMAANGERTPIAKEAILQHLDERKLQLTKVGTFDPPKPVTIGEVQPLAHTYGRGAGFRVDLNGPGFATWTAEHPSTIRAGTEPRWEARIPNSIAPGLPESYQGPDPARPGDWSGSHATFDTPEDAEAWVRARLSMGQLAERNLQYEGYMVPGPKGGSKIKPREDRHLLPGEIASNRIDPAAHKGHFPEQNVMVHVRAQDYTLDPAVTREASWQIHELGPDGAARKMVGEEWFPNVATDRLEALKRANPTKQYAMTEVPAETHSDQMSSESDIAPGEQHWVLKNPDGAIIAQYPYAHKGWAEAAATNHNGSIELVPGTPPKPQRHDFHVVLNPDGHAVDVYTNPDSAAREAEKIGGTVRVDPKTPLRTGTLLDEVQSDYHQAAKRARKLEVARRREEEIAKRIADSGGTLNKIEARAQVPRQAFNRYVPDDFGYRDDKVTKDQIERLTASQPEIQARLEKAREAYDAAREAAETDVQAAKRTYLRSQGFDSIDDTYDVSSRPIPEGFSDTGAYLDHARNARRTAQFIEPSPELVAARDAAAVQLNTVDQELGRIDAEIRRLRTDPAGRVPDAPFKETAWQDYALKHEILQAAADPDKSFLGFVGGQEQADRYNLTQRISKVAFNPEDEKLYVYGTNGEELESYNMGSESPSLGAFMEYLPEGAAYDLFDRIQDWTPPTPEARQALETQRAQQVRSRTRGRRGDIDWESYGTERERRHAMDQYMERERESYAESIRGDYEVVEEEIPQFTAEPIYNRSEQPPLPGMPDPPHTRQVPVLDEDGDQVYETEYRVVNGNYNTYDPEDPDTYQAFETNREAERHIDQMVEDDANSYEPEEPDDLEYVYGHLDPPEEEDPEPLSLAEAGLIPSVDRAGLQQGGEGMLSSYDHVLRHRLEKLLAPFGGDLMRKISIPGQSGRAAYAWILDLTPEMKERILKTGFSLMGLALALRDSNAPQEVKDAVMRVAAMDARRKKRTGTGTQRQPAA